MGQFNVVKLVVEVCDTGQDQSYPREDTQRCRVSGHLEHTEYPNQPDDAHNTKAASALESHNKGGRRGQEISNFALKVAQDKTTDKTMHTVPTQSYAFIGPYDNYFSNKNSKTQ